MRVGKLCNVKGRLDEVTIRRGECTVRVIGKVTWGRLK